MLITTTKEIIMKKIKLSKREVSLMYKAIDNVIKDYEETGTSYACNEIIALSKPLVKKYREFYDFDKEDFMWPGLHGENISWRLNLMLLFIEVCK